MAFLTTAEIKSHLYSEISDEIQRTDTSILQSAIDAAIAEAKGYLSAYDLDAIFNATGSDRNSILLLFVKDIAVWHFINLCNPNIDLQLRQDRYDNAIKWLDKVQRGQVVPELPVPTVEPPQHADNFIKYGSNHKRPTHF